MSTNMSQQTSCRMNVPPRPPLPPAPPPLPPPYSSLKLGISQIEMPPTSALTAVNYNSVLGFNNPFQQSLQHAQSGYLQNVQNEQHADSISHCPHQCFSTPHTTHTIADTRVSAMNTHQSYSHSPATMNPWYCEPCDKEFGQYGAYETHIASHEKCRYQGCNFTGTKKVVVAHFHGSHGTYSGSGFKTVDVEGQ